MKALKVIGIILVLLVVIIAGGVYLVFNNLGDLVKYAVEEAGPKVTKTSVTLNEVDLDLPNGKAGLNGFRVGNPEGFNTSHLFNLDKIFVFLDPSSVTNDVIVLKNITIEGVGVIVEQKGTTTNIQQLLKNLGGSEQASDETSQKTETSSGQEKKFMVEKLRFADGSLRLVTEKYGEKSLKLSELEVSNLGSRDEGLTSEQLGKAILAPLLKHAKREAEKAMQSEARKKIEEKAKSEIQDELEKSESLKGAKEKLKNLF